MEIDLEDILLHPNAKEKFANLLKLHDYRRFSKIPKGYIKKASEFANEYDETGEMIIKRLDRLIIGPTYVEDRLCHFTGFSYIELEPKELKQYALYNAGQEYVNNPDSKDIILGAIIGGIGGCYAGAHCLGFLAYSLMPNSDFTTVYLGTTATSGLIGSTIGYLTSKMDQSRSLKAYAKYKDKFESRTLYGMEALKAALEPVPLAWDKPHS